MASPKPHLFTYRMAVPFQDVDMMQVAWHGNYVRYLEQARCAWLADMQYGYMHWRDDGYMYPIAQLQLKYIKSAVFDEEIAIEIYLADCDTALRLDYVLKNAAGEVLCKAQTLQAAVSFTEGTQYQVHSQLQRAIAHYLENKNA